MTYDPENIVNGGSPPVPPTPATHGLGASEFMAAARSARRRADHTTMVLFEVEGSEPGDDSYTVTSVSYEEDLAGAIVIRGRALPTGDAMTSG